MKSERSQPFLVRLFLAIIAFKRMIANRRKWQITKKQKQILINSTLINEIKKSQKAVKSASFGRSVIDLNENKIREYRKEEAERKEKEKEKRIEIQLLKKKRRGGMRSYGDMKQLTESNTNNSLNVDPYSLTVADRIRALKSKYTTADFYREDPAQKRIPGFRPPSIVKDSTTITTTTPATTTNKDLTNILQKNLHISRPPDQAANQSTSKIKSNLKNMKKLDLQEVLNYAPGTAVYFGATVAIQSRHGGFLSFNNASDIKASAHKILPSARFVIWNCDDLQDHGVVRYGDAVWLQAGVHEVLGAQYGGKSSNSDDGMRKIHPALINCRKENFFKAQQYGRWIVLNRADPTGMLGEQVLHHDQIMLEQEWCFLASQTPYDSFMETYNCLENDKNNSNNKNISNSSKKADFFHPPEECQWKLHLVTLPSDDNPDSRFRQYLLEQAKHQIKISTQERRKKETVLCVSLARSLPPELQPDQVVARHMPHVLSSEATQHHLLSKFDKQMLRAFRSEGNDVKFLKHVYGSDSLVYKKAKSNADAHAEEVKSSISKDLLYLSETITSSSNELLPKSTLVEAENAYWDVANMVLMDTKGWVNLPSAMNKFEDISNEKKDIAARKIQKFLKEKMVNVFGWKRNFRRIDGENLRKLRHQAAISVPIPSSAVISKLKARTPLSLQNLSNNNINNNNSNNNNNNNNSPNKPLVRPESAPDLHKTTIGLGRKASSLRNLQDAINSRPTTAPNAVTFLTEDPRELYSSNTPASSRKEIVALCRQRRSSSVSAMLTARKMLFSDNSPTIPGSVVIEDGEDIEETEPQTLHQNNQSSNNLNNNNNNNHTNQKQKRRKKRFEQMIDLLGKTKERDYGLPRDVFQDSQKEISVYTTLHFLRASSSSPQIYGDISVKKKASNSR